MFSLRNHLMRTAAWSPEGSGSQPTGSEPAPASSGAPAVTAPPPSTAVPATQTTAPTRPEGIHDKFWDAKTGVKWGDLNGELGRLQALEAEAGIISQGVPEKPDGYKLSIEGFKVPDGIKLDAEKLAASPLMKGWRDLAHERGLTQEDFDAGVKLYLGEAVREKQSFAEASAKALEPLGKDASQRVENLRTMLNKTLGEKAGALFGELLFSAPIVEGFETLFRSSKGGAPGVGAGATSQNGQAQNWDERTNGVSKILIARANERARAAQAGR